MLIIIYSYSIGQKRCHTIRETATALPPKCALRCALTHPRLMPRVLFVRFVYSKNQVLG